MIIPVLIFCSFIYIFFPIEAHDLSDTWVSNNSENGYNAQIKISSNGFFTNKYALIFYVEPATNILFAALD